jgi:hypothetical protein
MAKLQPYIHVGLAGRFETGLTAPVQHVRRQDFQRRSDRTPAVRRQIAPGAGLRNAQQG